MERRWVELEGLSYEKGHHGVENVRKSVLSGHKVGPILLIGSEVLDGHTVCEAYELMGKKLVEAIVVSESELGDKFTIHGYDAWVGRNGLQNVPLLEGQEGRPTLWLYKSDSLRIEGRENIHVHWGPGGKYRLELGRRDLLLIAEAFEHFDG